MYLSNLDIFLIITIFALHFSIIFFVKSRTNATMLSFVSSLIIILLFGNIISNQILLKEILLVLMLFLLMALCLLFYMEKRLIIVDREKNSDFEIYLRSIFFLVFGLVIFSSISFSSFYIVKNIKIERRGESNYSIRNTQFFMDEFREIDEKNTLKKDDKVKQGKNFKELITLKQMKNLQNNSFFRRFEDMILLYLGASIFFFIFLRRKENETGGADEG